MKNACLLLTLAALTSVPVWAASHVDPMQPTYVPARGVTRGARRQAPALRLQAVLGNDSARVAVINGHVLQPGERIGAATVRLIGADHVELQAGKARWMLRLPATLR